jgi:hypothetical protein
MHKLSKNLAAIYKFLAPETRKVASTKPTTPNSGVSRFDHVRKIRDRKQRTNIGKYSFVNRTIKNWNQLPAEALGTSPCKPKIVRNRVWKAIMNGVK